VLDRTNHRFPDGEKILSPTAAQIQAEIRRDHHPKKQKNRKVAKRKPWTRGLYEGVVAADLISKAPLKQRNFSRQTGVLCTKVGHSPNRKSSILNTSVEREILLNRCREQTCSEVSSNARKMWECTGRGTKKTGEKGRGR